MQFFNFHNEQSFHFFKWVTDGGGVDASAMVAKALSRPGSEDSVPMGRENIEAAHAKLRGWLIDLVETVTGFGLDKPTGIGSPAGGGPDAFTRPLLHDAVRKIHFGAVAEALMRINGKWVEPNYPSSGPVRDTF